MTDFKFHVSFHTICNFSNNNAPLCNFFIEKDLFLLQGNEDNFHVN